MPSVPLQCMYLTANPCASQDALPPPYQLPFVAVLKAYCGFNRRPGCAAHRCTQGAVQEIMFPLSVLLGPCLRCRFCLNRFCRAGCGSNVPGRDLQLVLVHVHSHHRLLWWVTDL